MKKRNIIVFAAILIVAAVVIFSNISKPVQYFPGKEEIYIVSLSDYNDASLTNIIFMKSGDSFFCDYYAGKENVLQKCELNKEDAELILDKVVSYEQNVYEKRNQYKISSNDHESSAVATLFEFSITADSGKFRYVGTECKPDGYEEFIAEIEEILGKY